MEKGSMEWIIKTIKKICADGELQTHTEVMAATHATVDYAVVLWPEKTYTTKELAKLFDTLYEIVTGKTWEG